MFSVKKRYILALMGVMATINVYISRLNISIAVVAMVNVTFQESLHPPQIDAPGQGWQTNIDDALSFRTNCRITPIVPLGIIAW